MLEAVKSEVQNPQSKARIIVALDVPTSAEARKIVEELKDEVDAFKVGLQLFTSAGASFVREIVSREIKVFLDVKFHDIPNTVAKAAVEVVRLGVWMFNIHALGGGEMMRRTIGEVREVCEKEQFRQPKIIGVTVLTSVNLETLKEIGIDKKVDAQVLRLAQLTAKCELDGVVASPHETEIIRENVKRKDFLIITPGVRPKLGTSDDQRRVMTPKDAVQNGSDYLVIGRPILQAADKVQAVREILAEIDS